MPPLELSDQSRRAAIDRDINVHECDESGRSAAILVGIGAGPVKGKDAVEYDEGLSPLKIDDGNGSTNMSECWPARGSRAD